MSLRSYQLPVILSSKHRGQRQILVTCGPDNSLQQREQKVTDCKAIIQQYLSWKCFTTGPKRRDRRQERKDVQKPFLSRRTH